MQVLTPLSWVDNERLISYVHGISQDSPISIDLVYVQ